MAALHRDVGVAYAFMFWKVNIPHLNAKSSTMITLKQLLI